MTTKRERAAMRKRINTGKVGRDVCAALDRVRDRVDAAFGLPKAPRTVPSDALFKDQARADTFKLLADIEERDELLREVEQRNGYGVRCLFCGRLVDAEDWHANEPGAKVVNEPHSSDCLITRIRAVLG